MPTGVYKRTKKHRDILKGRKHSEETKKKMSLVKKGKTPKNFKKFVYKYWEGKKRENVWNKVGKYKSSHGYILVLKPEHPNSNNEGYIYEHRLVMEKHLGRELTSKEKIHHLDFDKSNNDINNLHLFSNNSEHRKYHIFLRQLMIEEIRKNGQIFSNNVVNQYV